MGGSLYYYFVLRENPAAVEAAVQKSYTVTQTSFVEIVDVSGNVQPRDSQDVTAEISGELSGILVSEGDHVVAGQLLATLVDTSQKYDLMNIENQIETVSDTASLEYDILNLDQQIAAAQDLTSEEYDLMNITEQLREARDTTDLIYSIDNLDNQIATLREGIADTVEDLTYDVENLHYQLMQAQDLSDEQYSLDNIALQILQTSDTSDERYTLQNIQYQIAQKELDGSETELRLLALQEEQAQNRLDLVDHQLGLLYIQQQQAETKMALAKRQIALLTTQIAQREADLAQAVADLTYLTLPPAQAAVYDSEFARKLRLLEAQRAEAQTKLDTNATQIDLLELKYAQTEQSIADKADKLELLQMQRSEKQKELVRVEEDLALLELKRTQAEASWDATRIYAAIDGTVSEIDARIGDMISTNTTLMRIVDLSSLTALVEIDEIDMGSFEVGQTMELEFDSYPDKTIPAYVSAIPYEGRYTSQGIGVVDVEITIDDPPHQIYPGFTFAGGIQVSDEGDVLMVSQDAVTETPNGGSVVMVQQEDGSFIPARVTVEYVSDGMVRILTGEVKAGDVLITFDTSASAEGGTTGLLPLPGMSGGGVPGTRVPGSGGGAGGGRQ